MKTLVAEVALVLAFLMPASPLLSVQTLRAASSSTNCADVVNDLRKHKDFHPEKHDAYEDGNHGYRKDYGDKNLYKEQYRKAFIRGYEDAFNRH